MRAVAMVFLGYLTMLCRLFDVTSASITRDRRGNLPPPSGGIASF